MAAKKTKPKASAKAKAKPPSKKKTSTKTTAKPSSKKTTKTKTKTPTKTKPSTAETSGAPTRRSASLDVVAPALAGTFPIDAVRSVWFARQGLGPASANASLPIAKSVAKSGWLRTLGGGDVYIAARARRSGMRRAELDDATASHALRVLPAVRGCIYLVPEEHADVALRFAEGIWKRRTDRDLVKVGATWKELEALATAVRAALEKGPLSTDALRRALPKDAVKSLGELGKKIGMSSLLPVAIRMLEFRGEVERRLEGGRLDTDRYLWQRAVAPAPEAGQPVHHEAQLLDSIAKIFFSQMGPATLSSFADWAGVTQTEATAAVRRVGLAPIAIEGQRELAYVDEDGLPALDQPATFGDHVTFLSFEDNLIVPHGGPGLFAAPRHHALEVHSWGTSRPVTLGDAKHLATRTILVGDAIAGFWEFDPDAQELVTWMFDQDHALRDHVEAEATAFARFLFEEVGHARSFSLDTDDSVRERARELRQRRRG